MLISALRNLNEKSPASNANPGRPYWDPLGDPINPEDSRTHVAALKAKLEYFKAHPNGVRRNLYLLLLLPAAAAFVSIAAFPQAFWHALVFGAMPALFYYFSIQTF